MKAAAVLSGVSRLRPSRTRLKVQDGKLIIVNRIPVKKHKTLKERIAGYKGDYTCGEWDTGKPRGKEVF